MAQALSAYAGQGFTNAVVDDAALKMLFRLILLRTVQTCATPAPSNRMIIHRGKDAAS
jgi:hypothetical protein